MCVCAHTLRASWGLVRVVGPAQAPSLASPKSSPVLFPGSQRRVQHSSRRRSSWGWCGATLRKVGVKDTHLLSTDCLKVMTHLTDTFAQQTPVTGKAPECKDGHAAPPGGLAGWLQRQHSGGRGVSEYRKPRAWGPGPVGSGGGGGAEDYWGSRGSL